MDIFEKIRELKWPKNSYVIVGGGALVALGLIAWDEDIDITVSRELFDSLKAVGWRQEPMQDMIVVKHGIYDVGTRFGDWALEQLLEDALWIQDIPFINLTKLKAWKAAMGRPKDLAHVRIIEDYLSKPSKIA